MQSVTASPILDLAAELQTACFCALGEVDGTLVDAFHMATTSKTLWAVYQEHRLAIGRHIVVSIFSGLNRHLANFRIPIRPNLMFIPTKSYRFG